MGQPPHHHAMLLNLVHLLPDLTGALICPKQRLIALSDPLTPGDSPRRVADTLRALATLLRQRRPARVVWLGSTLPALAASGRIEAAELAHLTEGLSWVWVADSLPDGLPGEAVAELKCGGLTFRHQSGPTAKPGEVLGSPWPEASCDGQTRPCFVLDGRRLILPAFGPRPDGGTNVLAPPVHSLFRRPFQVLMLAGGRIVTRPRARLDGAAAAAGSGTGQRISLLGAPS
jgi:metallophosphoesterase superfamily enzyme